MSLLQRGIVEVESETEPPEAKGKRQEEKGDAEELQCV